MEPEACAAQIIDSNKIVYFENNITKAHICGDIILIETQPTKWSFRDFQSNYREPIKGIRVSSSCGIE